MTKTPTRDRLVDAAIARFYKDGFRNVGIDQILSDVGISKTAFYKHFASKDDLLLAALDAKGIWLEEVCRKKVWEKGGPTPEGQLRSVFEIIEFFLTMDEFQGCIFVRAAMEFPFPTEPVFQAAARNKKAFEAFVLTIAQHCDVADPEGLSRKLCLIAEGAYVTQHVTGNPDTLEDARAMVQMVIDQALDERKMEAATEG